MNILSAIIVKFLLIHYDLLMKSISRKGILTAFIKKKRLNVVFNYLNKLQYKSLLDYGCSDAPLLKLLNKDLAYVGLDINKALIDENQKNFPEINFITKINDEKFDIICLIAVIEHLPDPLNLLRSLKKI